MKNKLQEHNQKDMKRIIKSMKRKKPEYIDATVYDLYITTDFIHNWGQTIREVYIPSEGIFFNQKGCGMLHVGRYDDAKKVGTTKITGYIRDITKTYVKAKQDLESIQEDMDNWTKTKHLEKEVEK